MNASLLLLGDPADLARYHPVEGQRPALVSALRLLELRGGPRLALEEAIGPAEYSALEGRLTDQALVVNAIDNWDQLDAAAARRTAAQLLGYVAAGGRLLVWHQGIIAKQTPELLELYGGVFRHHDPATQLRFVPETEGPAAEWCATLGAWTAQDEPYEFTLSAFFDDACTPYLHYEYRGERLVAGWTRRYGLGHVAYFVPGHDRESCASTDFVACLAAVIGRLLEMRD